MRSTHGALVDKAQPNAPAAKAGIRSGDVITAFDGKAIKDSRELARQVAAASPDSSVKLDVIRGAKPRR